MSSGASASSNNDAREHGRSVMVVATLVSYRQFDHTVNMNACSAVVRCGRESIDVTAEGSALEIVDKLLCSLTRRQGYKNRRSPGALTDTRVAHGTNLLNE